MGESLRTLAEAKAIAPFVEAGRAFVHSRHERQQSIHPVGTSANGSLSRSHSDVQSTGAEDQVQHV